MNFYVAIILFIFPLAGVWLSVVAQEVFSSRIKYFLSFSGAFLFGIVLLNLLPEVYEADSRAPYFILGGFFFQIFMESLTQGAEHGHIHIHNSDKKLPLPLLFGLGLHVFLECFSLGSGFFNSAKEFPFALGIGIHEIPAAFALMVILKHGNLSKTKMLMIGLLYSAVAPIGYFTGNYSQHLFSAESIALIMAVVAGTFFHISTTVLFENSPDHRYNIKKIAFIICGITTALLLTLIKA